jgi:site-specific DNA-methyltransferase (adenine-specific)
MARKPFKGTVEKNYGCHGTGGLNIDECRIDTADNLNGGGYSADRKPSTSEWVKHGGTIHSFTGEQFTQPEGRWPANLIHDGSSEVLALFPTTTSGKMAAGTTRKNKAGWAGDMPESTGNETIGDSGSAARFFYCAKASKTDRNEGCENIEPGQYSHDGRDTPIDNAYQRNSSSSSNSHPTVKPADLMRYLCRLVTPQDGTILDPFMGSGSTGKAAVLEGFKFVGIEREANYLEIATARIAAVTPIPEWLQLKVAV